jgi:hypothetical protein
MGRMGLFLLQGFFVSLLGLGVRSNAPFFFETVTGALHPLRSCPGFRDFFRVRFRRGFLFGPVVLSSVCVLQYNLDLYQIVLLVRRYPSADDDDTSFVIGSWSGIW